MVIMDDESNICKELKMGNMFLIVGCHKLKGLKEPRVKNGFNG